MTKIDPKQFGLSSGTVLEFVDEQHLALVIRRKSRIVMADGRKILDKLQSIQKVKPDLHLILKTNAPVCGKTRAFLSEQGIDFFPEI